MTDEEIASHFKQRSLQPTCGRFKQSQLTEEHTAAKNRFRRNNAFANAMYALLFLVGSKEATAENHSYPRITQSELRETKIAKDTGSVTIKGRVTDSKGVAVHGAIVSATNSSVGTVTDEKGCYNLTLSNELFLQPSLVLQISSVGYSVVTHTLDAWIQELNIVLEEVCNSLQGEVLIVGGAFHKPSRWQRFKALFRRN